MGMLGPVALWGKSSSKEAKSSVFYFTSSIKTSAGLNVRAPHPAAPGSLLGVPKRLFALNLLIVPSFILSVALLRV